MIEAIPVIYASNLPHATDYEWDDFSFGDAAHTLVKASNLIREVERRGVSGFCDDVDQEADEDDRVMALLEALSEIPPGVLVAFDS